MFDLIAVKKTMIVSKENNAWMLDISSKTKRGSIKIINDDFYEEYKDNASKILVVHSDLNYIKNILHPIGFNTSWQSDGELNQNAMKSLFKRVTNHCGC